MYACIKCIPEVIIKERRINKMKITNVKFENEYLKIGDIILFSGSYYIISKNDDGVYLYDIETNSNDGNYNDINDLMESLEDHEIKRVKSLTIGGN
jgi:hypothetical protein